MEIKKLNFGLPVRNNVANNVQNNNKFSFKNDLNTCDVFQKSDKQISFKGLHPVLENRINLFSAEIEKHVMNENFDLDKINTIVKRFDPNSSVKAFSALDKDVVCSEATNGYTKAPIGIQTDGSVFVTERTIFVTPPKNETLSEKIRVIRNLTHEFSHCAQFEDRELSKIPIINNYLKTRGINQETLKNLQISHNVFKHAENEVAIPLAVFLNKSDQIPVRVSEVSENVLDNIMRRMVGTDTDTFIKTMFEKSIRQFEQKVGKLDHEYTLAIAEISAMTEADATAREYKKAKEILKINAPTDYEFITVLYNKIAKIAKTMRK